MDEDRLRKLTDKTLLGPRVAEFWKSLGKTTEQIAKKTKNTNLARYEKGDALPRWENMVAIVDACDSDLATLVKFLDPGAPEEIAGIEIVPGYEHYYRLLTGMIRNELARNDQYFIEGIESNLYGMYGEGKMLPRGVPPRKKRPIRTTATTEDKGNIASNEKKKAGK